MRFLMLLGFIAINIEVFAQIDEGMLVGKWQCYHTELEDGSTGEDHTFDGEPYSCENLIIELNDDYRGWESVGGYTFKYSLKDSILQLGNRRYVVEYLSQEELIFKEYDTDGMEISIFRKKFKKED